jgi:tRNA (guanine-N7-)-methyltransferase
LAGYGAAAQGGTVTVDDDKPEGRRAFFGRRKGHRLRSRQAGLIDSLLPNLALDVSNPPPRELARLFPVPVDAIRLEIGFGGGEYLTTQAEALARTGFIGCEPFVNGMAKALAAIEARALANVRLHLGDAVPVIDWLPTASVAGVDLVYPDPWPKRRHWKRRFVQERTIADMARILRPGSEFRFVSDIPDYAAWTLARLLRSADFIWTAERADDWRRPWPGFVRTRYEAKAVREGRVPCYLVFRRR